MTNLPEPDRSAASRASVDKQAAVIPSLPTLKPQGFGDSAAPEVFQRTTVAAPITVSTDQQETPDSIRERLRRNRRPVSSVAASFLFHGSVLLLLGLVAWNWSKPALTPGVTAEFSDVPQPELATLESDQTVEINFDNEMASPIDNVSEDLSTEETLLADSAMTSPLTLESLNPTPANNSTNVLRSDNQPLPSGGGLQGRSAESRAKLAAAYGGTPGSEAAVERGLKWIIQHQYPDGGWRLRFHDGPCDGRCRHEGMSESVEAATALSLLSLLGAGYTSRSGRYQKEVRAGIDFLLGRIRENRFGGSLNRGDHGMYAHALATMALSEAFALTQESGLAGPVLSTKTYIENAQGPDGGWRYVPGRVGDMSVTGWHLMALKSCQLAGFETDADVWKKSQGFVDSMAVSSKSYYRYGYERRGDEPTSTAIGLLMQMYFGWPRDHMSLAEGAMYLAEEGPSRNDVYFNYYTTVLLHHRRGKYWPEWNQRVRDHLIATQSRKGHEAGSWHFRNEFGNVGGRLYSTAMAIMTLEVYYRFMPLYGFEPLVEPDEVKVRKRR